jgi:hypothetical protein
VPCIQKSEDAYLASIWNRLKITLGSGSLNLKDLQALAKGQRGLTDVVYLFRGRFNKLNKQGLLKNGIASDAYIAQNRAFWGSGVPTLAVFSCGAIPSVHGSVPSDVHLCFGDPKT